MNKQRLLRLADKLQGVGAYDEIGPVPLRKFEISQWAADMKAGARIEFEDFNPDRCNTAACACGWAGSDPWFKRHGLVFRADCDDEIMRISAEFFAALEPGLGYAVIEGGQFQVKVGAFRRVNAGDER